MIEKNRELVLQEKEDELKLKLQSLFGDGKEQVEKLDDFLNHCISHLIIHDVVK